jgi:hypothetical protein
LLEHLTIDLQGFLTKFAFDHLDVWTFEDLKQECEHSIQLELGGQHSFVHYRLQHWPILYNIFTMKLIWTVIIYLCFICLFTATTCYFDAKVIVTCTWKWWNHYCQNDIKSSLLLPIMCEKKKKSSLPKMFIFTYKLPPIKIPKSPCKTWVFLSPPTLYFNLKPCYLQSQFFLLE